MWNSPNKLLFFDEEDFVKSPNKDDVTNLAESGQFKGTNVSDADHTQLPPGEFKFPERTHPRPRSPSMQFTLQDYATSREDSTTLTSKSFEHRTETMFKDQHMLTSTPPHLNIGSRSPVVSTAQLPSIDRSIDRLERVQIPMKHMSYTKWPLPIHSTRMRTDSRLKTVEPMVVTMPQVAAACSTGRLVPVPTPLLAISHDQPVQQGFRNQPEHLVSEVHSQQLMSATQPEPSDLQRLQSEALGARPKCAVVLSSKRRLAYGESETEHSSLQNLCSLMEIQAQVSLRHSLSGLSPECTFNMPPNPATPSSGALLDRSSMHCNFCKRNGERKMFYSSHNLQERGRVTCPVLQRYVCPLCGATGGSAHTVSYCPLGSGPSSVAAIRTLRKACGCKRICKHGEENRH